MFAIWILDFPLHFVYLFNLSSVILIAIRLSFLFLTLLTLCREPGSGAPLRARGDVAKHAGRARVGLRVEGGPMREAREEGQHHRRRREGEAHPDASVGEQPGDLAGEEARL